MVLCDLYLIKFVLTKGLLFDTFFIFGTNRDGVINEYLINFVFSTNEFVNQTIHWNQTPHRQDF